VYQKKYFAQTHASIQLTVSYTAVRCCAYHIQQLWYLNFPKFFNIHYYRETYWNATIVYHSQHRAWKKWPMNLDLYAHLNGDVIINTFIVVWPHEEEDNISHRAVIFFNVWAIKESIGGREAGSWKKWERAVGKAGKSGKRLQWLCIVRTFQVTDSGCCSKLLKKYQVRPSLVFLM